MKTQLKNRKTESKSAGIQEARFVLPSREVVYEIAMRHSRDTKAAAEGQSLDTNPRTNAQESGKHSTR